MAPKARQETTDLEWIAADLRPLARSIQSLAPDPRNARRHDEANLRAIQSSLRAHGQRKPIVVRGGVVLAGNGTLAAARELGWTHLACVEYEGPEALARAFAVADNRSAELASWDDAALAEALAEADAAGLLDATAFDKSDADAIVAEARGGDEGEDPGPQDPPAHPVSEAGEIYALGPHRLMCGDSTSAEDVQRLMGGELACLMATDPPYLVDYDGTNHPSGKGKNNAWKETTQKWAGKGDTTNKQWDEYKDPDVDSDLFAKFIAVALEHALDHERRPAIYQWYASRRHVLVEEAWKANGVLVHQQIIWVKSRPILTRSHFMWQHEPCLYGWVEGNAPELRPEVCGENSTVWTIAKAGEEDNIHPTQKPLEIFERPIGYHTRAGDLVYEPFCGSGTQVIAAAKLGRRCFAMERAPEFCDAIRRRWTKFARSAGVDPGTGALE